MVSEEVRPACDRTSFVERCRTISRELTNPKAPNSDDAVKVTDEILLTPFSHMHRHVVGALRANGAISFVVG